MVTQYHTARICCQVTLGYTT